MEIGAGSRLGPYEIVSRIGAGGMGEVFKARDTRLERSVAVKILPVEFARDAQLQSRFEREAKTISQLSHPNICTLHDVGNENGLHFLVMELLEGESLAERLVRGPMPLPEVLRYGAQLAEALGKAHRVGVVHRDLKPGNVMLTKNGIKLLDFGLAKSVEGAWSSTGSTHMEMTEHKPLTQEGTILGTFQYMAPEQLEGAEADARTDIFGLGAVLYEMATGRRAFEGKNKTSLIAAIVSSQPRPLAEVQPLTPPALEHVISRCLEKDPDDRWQSAQDVAEELRWISAAGSQASVAAPVAMRRKHRELLAWIIAAVAVAAAVPLGISAYRNRTRVLTPVESAILPPVNSSFVLGEGAMQLSPDGKRLAFLAEVNGQRMLWVRTLANPRPQPLAGTEDASYPFWSPDSRQIAFFANGKLRKIDAAGGPAQSICDAQQGRGGTWNQDNVIIYAIVRDGLYQTRVTGETPVRITAFDASTGEADHRWPWFLPDGKHYLFLARAENPEDSIVWVGTLGSKDRTRIVQSSGQPAFVGGKLLYTRNKTLLAQPFDPGSLKLAGESVPLAEGVAYVSGTASANYTANATLLVVARNQGKKQLKWFDELGRETGVAGGPADYQFIRLSPDGKHIAAIVEDAGGRSAVWTSDLVRGTSSRFTFGTAEATTCVWSPDGEAIVFGSLRKPPAIDLVTKSFRGSTVEQMLWESDSQRQPFDWSKKGDLLLGFHNGKKKIINDIWLFNVATKKATPLVESPFTEVPGNFSPDGEWFVYSSNESGRSEVFAQPIARPGKWQISTNGGTDPHWSPRGDRILYLSNDRKVISVPVKAAASLEAGEPKTLFDLKTNIRSSVLLPFDIATDGRIVIVEPILDDVSGSFQLVANWTSLVRSKQE
jgi:serine/threonine protein kinase